MKSNGAKRQVNYPDLADKVAKWLMIVSITIGVATFAYWFSVEKICPLRWKGWLR